MVRGSSTGRPIMVALDLLGRRWTLRVLWELRDEPVPYRRLRERCDEVSSSVLATRLRELAAAGVIEQTNKKYTLTRAGEELLDHLRPLNEWAKKRLT